VKTILRTLFCVAPLIVGGCVPAMLSPTVSVIPGPNKSLEAFAIEQAACKQFAELQITEARNQINNQIAGTVLLNAALGASQAAGGTGGDIAASAAASGLAAANANVPNAQAATIALQQQYDGAYSQCMYAKGNQVPGFQVAAPVTHRRPVHRRTKRRAPQGEAATEQKFIEPPAAVEPVSAPAAVMEPPPAKH
jgi:hypothetical protein